MKLNWGTSIAIAITLFIGFIMVMVVTMLTDKGFDHDMVTTDYYKKELLFQQEIDAEQNAKNLGEIKGLKTTTGWAIEFPESVAEKEFKGKVSLYRPSDKQLDFELPIVLSGNYLLIPDNRLTDGRWDILITATLDGQPFKYKNSIIY
ncbi:cytochrome C oxidase Cbb3 [Nonlabens arenilitoris]|uniref:Cytochrome C oxidase Cbb3 n=1 Tax=Nonlabens arenilitoris TaxID=1217969 RepID=A0A2S7UCL0_9FLAO|nr:FixH family protein [Nonlabens arenilitoris]PQJ32350.1 cytochrome C oxidase Cbb3 [Nonlabens arenilitoris]